MTKLTEQEVIEINLESQMNHFLITDLEKNIFNIPLNKRLPQFVFLESFLKKSKEKKPRFFSARECSTLCGYLMGSFQLTKDKTFIKLHDIIDTEFKKWSKENLTD